MSTHHIGHHRATVTSDRLDTPSNRAATCWSFLDFRCGWEVSMSADPRPPEDSYDRARGGAGAVRPRDAAAVLRSACRAVAPKPQRLEYRGEAVARALGGHLSASRLEYVNRVMRPCPPYLVTAASGHITWRDSRGVVNVAHTGPLGAVVPVVAREATLELWDRLATDTALVRRVGELDAESVRLLAATTTDRTRSRSSAAEWTPPPGCWCMRFSLPRRRTEHPSSDSWITSR
jgi:hypothetical protein